MPMIEIVSTRQGADQGNQQGQPRTKVMEQITLNDLPPFDEQTGPLDVLAHTPRCDLEKRDQYMLQSLIGRHAAAQLIHRLEASGWTIVKHKMDERGAATIEALILAHAGDCKNDLDGAVLWQAAVALQQGYKP
jgi:hypothetical protein